MTAREGRESTNAGPTRLTLAALNRMTRRRFTAALGGVCEHSPWVAARAWEARPFASLVELHLAMVAAIRRSSEDERLALLRAHPELGRPPGRPRDLTAFSAREQAAACLDRPAAREAARYERLNAAYRSRFGFPFIVCVRNHREEGILETFERRLANPAAIEIETALAEVCEIARHRLLGLVDVAPPAAARRRSPA